MTVWEPLGGPIRFKNGPVMPTLLTSIGQLDHYVVFGIKSGAEQDIQRGKKCPIGVKQTTLDPP